MINRNYRKPLKFKLSLSSVAPTSLLLATLIIIGQTLQQSSIVILVAYLVFGFAGLAIVWRGGLNMVRLYLTIYGLASIAAVMIAFIFISSYGVPYFKEGSDALHYEEAGLEFAGKYGYLEYGAIRGNIVSQWHNSVGYIYLMGLLAKFSALFGGFHTMVPRLFNAACLAILSVLIHLMAIRLGLRRRTAIIAALIGACLPLMMWVSVQTFRDIFQTLLLVFLVFLWLPDYKGQYRYSVPVLLGLSVILIIPIWEMRRAQAFVGLLLIGYQILLNKRSYSPIKFAFLTLPIIGFTLLIASQFYELLSKDALDIIQSIERYTELRGTDGTGGGLSLIVFETPLFPIGWVYRTAYALVSPLPVIFWPLDMAWMSLGTIFQILFIPFLMMGLGRAFLHAQWRNIAIAFVLLFIGMAMFTFTIRHIIQLMPFAILLVALGYENYRGNPARVYIKMAISGAILGVVYIFLKVL